MENVKGGSTPHWEDRLHDLGWESDKGEHFSPQLKDSLNELGLVGAK